MSMNRLLATLGVVFLAGCGGGGGADPAAPDPISVKSGVFVDARASGLGFTSAAGAGVTNANGVFDYAEGRQVEFLLGDISLGSAIGSDILTPVELVPGATGDDLFADPPAVINIVRLMMTLDADGQPGNGIAITSQARSAGAGRSINFAQSYDAFGADDAVLDYIAAATGSATAAKTNTGFQTKGERSLVSAEAARDHFSNSLRDLEDGSINNPPSVNAGADQAVDEGQTVTLTATAGDSDGDIVAFAWRELSDSGVALAGANTATANFVAPDVDADTVLQFEVTVTDNDGGADSSTVSITVSNVPENVLPVADAGADQAVNEQTTVTLDGTASSDADGSLATFSWEETSDSGVALSGADTAAPSFTAPMTTSVLTLTFRLTVTDDTGAMASDTVDVVVNPVNLAPTADAGSDQQVGALLDATLDGSASGDADGSIVAFAWESLDGDLSITNADQAQATVTLPDVESPTDLRFQLTVTDNEGASASDQTVVTVIPNTPPVADAGAPVAGDEGDTLLLSAANSNDADGDTLSYAWQQLAGTPASDLANADAAVLSLVAPQVDADEVLRFQVTVTDARGKSDSAEVEVTVYDIPVGKLRVGAAKASVVPEQKHIEGIEEPRFGGTTHLQKFNLGGFGIDPTQNFPDPFGAFGDQLTEPASERVHEGPFGPENTSIRALAIEQLNDDDSVTQVLFLSLDAVGAGNVIGDDLRAKVVEATGIAADNILFGQTHTHAGADLQGLWGGVPQDWINNVLYPAAMEAASAAIDALEPAQLEVRHGNMPQWNNYRRPKRLDGDIDSDTLATLTQARSTRSGEVLGTLFQFTAHPTSINEDPRIPHPDYILGAMDYLETQGDGGVALYFNGPIADASASGPTSGETPYDRVRSRGEGMATDASGFALDRVIDGGLSVRHQSVILPVTNPAFIAFGALGSFNRYYDFLNLPVEQIPGIGPVAAEGLTTLPQFTPTATTLVSRVSIGDGAGLEMVTIPGEATGTFGEFIRSLADDGDHVMLLGLTQNSFGYIIPEEEFSYFDGSGDDGLFVPFTGYEEFVSLGPLTAPLLRAEGYIPLFDAENSENVPDYLTACQADPTGDDCIFNIVGQRIDFIQSGIAGFCREQGGPEQFCGLLDPATPLAGPCRDAGLPDGICDVLDGNDVAGTDGALAGDAFQAAAAGCDMLDPAHCLFPFPSNHFIVDAPDGSIQAAGTGQRVNFNILGMPRNTAGKPIDPSEWNRNDGFSPGQMLLAYVPDLATNDDGTIPGAPPITDIGQSLNLPASSVVVIDTVTGEPHPVWAEIDLNAGLLLPAEGLENPRGKRAPIIIRPAVNFAEGRRYVVALKNLQDEQGNAIAAQQAFATCRDGQGSNLPPLQSRCDALASDVFPVLQNAGIATAGNNSLYLAWDFTVASAQNNIARLRHMRDDAFINHLGQTEDAQGNIIDLGVPPAFTVDLVTPNTDDGIIKRIEGTITIPSYMTPTDPAPGDNLSLQLESLCGNAPQEDLAAGCKTFFEAFGIADGGSLQPNRLFFNPTDNPNPADPIGNRYGDGLPDSTGTMTTRYTCMVPEQASPAAPARPGVYGHGLLDGHQAVNYDSVPDFGAAHNMMFCAVDLFGFSTGDVPNVLSVLLDLSNFAIIPDASQQGLLNYMFLARALRHPEGFAAHPEFQIDGRPVFSTREVFYDGNSQGGIVGGPVVALSKDIQRGALGVVGMNYSTLLRRSVDFDGEFEPGGLPPYALPLYLSYTEDLDRNLGFSLMQMLWDRSENNGYAHHMTDNSALKGPDNQLLLQPAFADHQVTHWSAQVMARTIGVDVADIYFRKPDESEPFTFANRSEFFAQRDPDIADYWNLPVPGRDANAGYDEPGCLGPVLECRTAKSGYIAFDQGRTAIPPIGNVPPRADDADPHKYPRDTDHGQCQKSHFLHTQGRLIDTRNSRDVRSAETCPDVAPVLLGDLPGDPGGDDDGFTQADCEAMGAEINEGGAEALCAALFALSPPDVAGFFDGVQDCSFDDTGPNCAFGAAFDNLGGEALGVLLAGVAEQCSAPGDDFCAAINDTLPDALPALSRPLTRGSLVATNADTIQPSAKTVDGDPSDWLGSSANFGGSQQFHAGEHIYTDFIFDARGADDGDDARRLALLGPVVEVNDRARRIDQLEQAVGDQLGVPRPVGALDSYGDNGLAAAADLHQVRWASDGQRAYLLASLVNLTAASQADLLVLADTTAGNGDDISVGFGLRTAQFDVAVRINATGVTAWDIASGDMLDINGDAAANAETNTVEASFDLAAISRDGVLRVAVVALDGSERPANVAYRFGEPVAGLYNEQLQALALLDGNVDGFVNLIDVADLTSGRTERVAPGAGYHERHFISGANISTERGEDGRLQHYGLYVPSSYDPATPTAVSYWLHYRGGKAHSGGAWTPRLIRQLGEDLGNIVATPRGRGTSSWYTTDAHQDVFEVIMDVEGLDVSDRAPTVDAQTGLANALSLNIDSSRRYLSGYSMGGYGTYLFGLLYPDLFAAGYSTSGATTQGAWTGVGPDDGLCGESLSGGGETASPCFIEANEGRANSQLTFRLLENGRHFPLSIHHGTNDELVPVTGIERFGARLTELGYRHDYLRFIGYEHFSQAGVDEWVEGARYMQRFTINDNPRTVTYKVVPALVDALNTVKPDPADATFSFAPDGAYWVDDLVVRDADSQDPGVTGQIEITSRALPGTDIVTGPQTGIWPDAPAPSSPVAAPGHSTPFVRSGLEWLPIGDAALSNSFVATLTGLSAARIDVRRMGLDLSKQANGSVTTDGITQLILGDLANPVDVYVGGNRVLTAAVGNQLLILEAGTVAIQLVPTGSTPVEQPADPTLAELCLAQDGPAEFCNLLAGDGDPAEEQCLAFGGPAEFCGLFGTAGDTIAALSDACAQLGGPALLCTALNDDNPDPQDQPPQPLLASVAERRFSVPVGVPLGGYLRPPIGGEFVPGLEAMANGDPNVFIAELLDFLPTATDHDGAPIAPLPDELRAIHSPYATYSPPSRGYYDSLTTKVVALHDGTDWLVMVKLDTIGMLDELRMGVAERVADATGIELGEGLLMSATHTHGGPGAVANDSTRYFWLAVDKYQPELFERLVDDIAQAVVDALDPEQLRPARIGWASGQQGYVDELTGATQQLNRFRRSRDPWTAEQIAAQDALRARLGVLRVDELNANGDPVRPLAVVTNYAAHGIAFGIENQFFSGDMLGAVERSVEARFDTPVVSMLVQSVGGDVSPRQGSGSKLLRIERYGELLAPQILDLHASIDQFETVPDIRTVSQRVILNRETLGYEDTEYPYPFGAAQCNSTQVPEGCLAAPPVDGYDLLDNGVAENGAFVPQDTIVSAHKIGGLTLLAQPGEPVAEYGERVMQAAADRGFVRDNTFIWGYSQDHIGYLLPDSKQDWLLGDTEGTTTFWGWKQGGRLLDVNIDLLDALASGSAPPADEFQLNYIKQPGVPPRVVPSLRPGRVITQPSDVQRFGTTTFSFEGGDPVVDLPVTRMERLGADGQWTTVILPNGKPLNHYFEMHLEYQLASGAHQWLVHFEPPKDWPRGVYRMVATGQALAAPSPAPTTYSVTSDAFAVSPSPSLIAGDPVEVEPGIWEATLAYTARPDNYRLIDAYSPVDQPAPVRKGQVTLSNGTDSSSANLHRIEARDGVLSAVYRGAITGPAVTATGFDVFGNSTPGGGGSNPPGTDFEACANPRDPACPLNPLAEFVYGSPVGVCLVDAQHDACPLAPLVSEVLANDPGLAPCSISLLAEGCVLADVASAIREQFADEPVFCTADQSRDFVELVGAMHEHSGYSDGAVGTEPRDYFAAGAAAGLAYMASADHSDNFQIPLTTNTDCLSEDFLDCLGASNDNPQDAFRKWDATAEQADEATTAGFTALRGFEWTSDRFGHISVYGSTNYLNAKTSFGYTATMEDFWQWFTLPAEPNASMGNGFGGDGLGVFNHPGREDAVHQFIGDPAFSFNGFGHVPAADYRMIGIEVFGKGDYYDESRDPPNGTSWMAFALDQGWHVGPISGEDHHDTGWAQADLPKTVVLARDNSADGLREAYQARRFYAVAKGYNDVRLRLTGNGSPMGSRLAVGDSQAVQFAANVTQPGNPGFTPRIDFVGPGGVVTSSHQGASAAVSVPVAEADERYRFVRVIDEATGRVVAVSAPIWFRLGEAYAICDSPKPQDSDGDGVPDNQDAFPNDPNESADADGDGVGDNADTDDDNDGVADDSDACPATEAGAQVDGQGCSDDQRDSDGNPSVATGAEAVVEQLQALCDDGGPAEFCAGFKTLTDAALLTATRVLTAAAAQCNAADIDNTACALLADVPTGDGTARAGAAVVDATWHFGASAGQFSATGAGIADGRGYDPYNHATRKVGSDTLADRITTRALVVEGGNGKRVAVVANDLYLPNDLLRRRVIQLLQEHDALALATGGTPTGITAANLAMTVSHSHASPFYSTPAVGPWIFQDVFDLRFYEYMAERMRDAVVDAAADMRAVTMGATAVYANDVRGHTYGPKVSDEARTLDTPAGQPYDYTTRQMYVMRFDDAATGDNYANWVVLGIHPEWVWGEEVISGDLTHATMRLLDRETGAITVMSQSETGTSGPHKDERAHFGSERHEYQEAAFAGAHRAARKAADNVLLALDNINADTPWDSNQHAASNIGFDVNFAFQRFAPPVTRPIPGVSNCNMDALYTRADPNIVKPDELPECGEVSDQTSPVQEPLEEPFQAVFENVLGEDWNSVSDAVSALAGPIVSQLASQLTELGIPLPQSISTPSYAILEEQATVPIQVFKLGDVAVTFCPCEQFTDPALNVISRLNRVAGDFHTGWDWDLGYAADNALRDPANNGDFVHGDDEVGCAVSGDTVTCPHPSRDNGGTLTMTLEAFQRMKAQIHNDARGWEETINGLHAESEPLDAAAIWGNFTHEEHTAQGYGLVIPVGMANDYWGYMPGYREYRAHDHYRKSLAGLGPHGADFLATRMSRLGALLNGGAGMPASPRDVAYLAEDTRAEAFSRSVGEAGRAFVPAYDATLPANGGTPGIVAEPADIQRFDGATVQWVGGSTWLGMPDVTVERCVTAECDAADSSHWITVGDQTGEVALHVDFLRSATDVTDPVVVPHPEDLATWRAGEFEWIWTAGYEAYVSEVPVTDADSNVPSQGGYATPLGTYRFVISGQHRETGGLPPSDYALTSAPFEVLPWDGIAVQANSVQSTPTSIEFALGPVTSRSQFQRGADTRDPKDFAPARIVGPVDYPDTWKMLRDGSEPLIPWLRDERNIYQYASGDEEQYCHRCTFRPWADTGSAQSVTVTTSLGAVDATSEDGVLWRADVVGTDIRILPGDIRDQWGNTNGACIDLVGAGCP